MHLYGLVGRAGGDKWGMSRLLSEMSGATLDRLVEANYSRLYREYYHLDEPDPCCKLCRYYDSDGYCSRTDEEADPDGCCDHHDSPEEDYPNYMDGD